ncbi:LptF/LptG family permease [Luteolibacter sp. SL250]|uniref:LptF/LptG family permease n=1 Tax=Luteolibacter sp. SL250 TaxID=2995170 RepID=UPI00226FFCA8|nr:LptF/LptG family permease [Luteolibacter sp. SL250]WAC21682.1 LptF/LptG family permease [Luteolibacter sp. SL250]
MNLSRPTFIRILLPLVLTVLGAVVCLLLLPGETAAVQSQLTGFPDSDVSAHLFRPTILAGMCFLPALAAVAYSLSGTLDRYIARQFLGIFAICLAALFAIWLLMDVQDNISEFLESGNVPLTMLNFYSARSSAIILFLLPYALLLSLLYSLGKFSSSREIVAVVQTGRSVPRITAPLIAAGLFCTLLCTGLNYHWAPTAEGRKDEILDAARGKDITQAKDVLYRNAEARRLWMVGKFPPNYEKGAPLLDVEVTTTRADHSLESRLTASRALWDRSKQTWTFENPTIGLFQPGMPPEFIQSTTPVVHTDWKETPWQIIKPGLSSNFLGVPDLNGWLRANAGNEVSLNPAPYLTQWHYRWALPFTCLVTVLLAAPLAIHFSRRGAGGGIFLAVVLSALMLLVSSISLVLGESLILPPALGAWLPNILFGAVGFYLFQRRLAGRPIYQRIRALFPDDNA